MINPPFLTRAQTIWQPTADTKLWLPGQDDAYSATIRDRSGNSNNGTITGATWARTSTGFWVLDFAAANSKIDCGNGASLQLERTDSFSWLIWASTTDTGNYKALMQKAVDGGDYTGIRLRKDDADKLRFEMYATLAKTILKTSDDAMLIDGKYHLWGGTYDGTSAHTGITLYEDGVVKAGTGSGGGTLDATITVAQNLLIGLDQTNAQDWGGKLALPRIEKRVIPASEWLQIYNKERHLLGV